MPAQREYARPCNLPAAPAKRAPPTLLRRSCLCRCLAQETDAHHCCCPNASVPDHVRSPDRAAPALLIRLQSLVIQVFLIRMADGGRSYAADGSLDTSSAREGGRLFRKRIASAIAFGSTCPAELGRYRGALCGRGMRAAGVANFCLPMFKTFVFCATGCLARAALNWALSCAPR